MIANFYKYLLGDWQAWLCLTINWASQKSDKDHHLFYHIGGWQQIFFDIKEDNFSVQGTCFKMMSRWLTVEFKETKSIFF